MTSTVSNTAIPRSRAVPLYDFVGGSRRKLALKDVRIDPEFARIEALVNKKDENEILEENSVMYLLPEGALIAAPRKLTKKDDTKWIVEAMNAQFSAEKNRHTDSDSTRKYARMSITSEQPKEDGTVDISVECNEFHKTHDASDLPELPYNGKTTSTLILSSIITSVRLPFILATKLYLNDDTNKLHNLDFDLSTRMETKFLSGTKDDIEAYIEDCNKARRTVIAKSSIPSLDNLSELRQLVLDYAAKQKQAKDAREAKAAASNAAKKTSKGKGRATQVKVSQPGVVVHVGVIAKGGDKYEERLFRSFGSAEPPLKTFNGNRIAPPSVLTLAYIYDYIAQVYNNNPSIRVDEARSLREQLSGDAYVGASNIFFSNKFESFPQQTGADYSVTQATMMSALYYVHVMVALRNPKWMEQLNIKPEVAASVFDWVKGEFERSASQSHIVSNFKSAYENVTVKTEAVYSAKPTMSKSTKRPANQVSTRGPQYVSMADTTETEPTDIHKLSRKAREAVDEQLRRSDGQVDTRSVAIKATKVEKKMDDRVRRDSPLQAAVGEKPQRPPADEFVEDEEQQEIRTYARPAGRGPARGAGRPSSDRGSAAGTPLVQNNATGYDDEEVDY